jgi:hypothetical protein
MKKLRLLVAAAAAACVIYKTLAETRQDRSIWSEYTDDVA